MSQSFPAPSRVRLTQAESIRRLISADELLWTEIAVPVGTALVRSGPRLNADDTLTAGLSAHAFAHPAVASYLRAGDDGGPRRVSDVVSWQDWSSAPVYADVFRARRARFQLSIVTHLDARGGRGWVLTRDLHDFSDRDVEVGRALLPLLALVDGVTGPDPSPNRSSTDPLTDREAEILELLSTGITARAIGTISGISDRTVGKHLEHIYRKLGANDRLTAVTAGLGLGLIADARGEGRQYRHHQAGEKGGSSVSR